MHLPAHSVWFWLLLGVPFLTWIVFWAIARCGKVSLKPVIPWLAAASCIFGPAYFLLDVASSHKALSFVLGMIFWTCCVMLSSIKNWYRFETLRAPHTKWYVPWHSAKFSIPRNLRILVRDVNAVSPWYVEKLGLRKLAESPEGESSAATYKFKEGGNSVVLSTRGNFETGKTPILFTKKIRKIKDVLGARGVGVGTIEQDRQGIRYFQIHDPEGNVIEVVEEP